jgi:hypothetical protein
MKKPRLCSGASSMRLARTGHARVAIRLFFLLLLLSRRTALAVRLRSGSRIVSRIARCPLCRVRRTARRSGGAAAARAACAGAGAGAARTGGSAAAAVLRPGRGAAGADAGCAHPAARGCTAAAAYRAGAAGTAGAGGAAARACGSAALRLAHPRTSVSMTARGKAAALGGARAASAGGLRLRAHCCSDSCHTGEQTESKFRFHCRFSLHAFFQMARPPLSGWARPLD